ncbi:unnamed protein product [Ostreobium quekettii]|uniref:Uncharacterized protein n=1 Tax=Ostreobium quekettii TaxID=121088 RepID=A0A8S1JE73_9CHLO|nr:unnamed protein product [Ostreobium quekettii]|eukprot:evm.model.scf_89.19 EVM.evm.TU.scf_89.19   scf_89:105872-107783(+)
MVVSMKPLGARAHQAATPLLARVLDSQRPCRQGVFRALPKVPCRIQPVKPSRWGAKAEGDEAGGEADTSTPTPLKPAESTPPVQQPLPATASEANEPEGPNYVAWIGTLLTVIGIFYVAVFYAGAGLFSLLAENVDFKRKDFVPYSERMKAEEELRLREGQSMQSVSAPEPGDVATEQASSED